MTVNEFYNRERDIESRVALMEEESGKLREKLRAHFRVEIKRADRRVSATASNRSKALLTFRNVTVAMFNSIRVTMAQDDGKLSIEETVKKLNVPVGRGFDHLKVVKTNGTSRLSLCNQRGNQFFEHKKYDSFYSSLSDDVKSFNPNMITSDNPINWLDINGRCGFWSCFQLKATEDPSSPLVINSRDKQPIGHMSPVVAYFEHASFVLNNGREDVRFTSPYLDKLQGEFFVIDSTTPSKRLQVDLNVFDVIDKESFTTMIETAFP
ncbi:hypothetical protein HDE_05822 [Halotydeus destructor]|nr:hypothetical protein HDE_05822 [Halotydeus destructor]